MKAVDLRELTITELEARLQDEIDALQDLKFSKAVTGQLENPARLRATSKEIARLKTIINEKRA